MRSSDTGIHICIRAFEGFVALTAEAFPELLLCAGPFTWGLLEIQKQVTHTWPLASEPLHSEQGNKMR